LSPSRFGIPFFIVALCLVSFVSLDLSFLSASLLLRFVYLQVQLGRCGSCFLLLGGAMRPFSVPLLPQKTGRFVLPRWLLFALLGVQLQLLYPYRLLHLGLSL
jgi:hypothetical protein